MNKTVSVFAICAVMISGTAFGACNKCHKKKTTNNTTTVVTIEPQQRDTFDYDAFFAGSDDNVMTTKRSYKKHGYDTRDWYVGLSADLSLLSWTNHYTATVSHVDEYSTDKYSFKPAFGGHFVLGHIFSETFRSDLELGYTGDYKDTDDEGWTFHLAVPYVMLNGYFNITDGWYLGAGVGMAFPCTTISSDYENNHKTSANVMLAGMLGYSVPIADNTALDLRYRLAATHGSKMTVNLSSGVGDVLNNRIDTIFDNSFSVGVRYMF